jgi:hypothetical protein
MRSATVSGAIPLEALLTGYVATRWKKTSTRESLGVVASFALLYGSLVGGTFVWALLGNPLVPSLPTLSMATIFSASFLLVAPFWALMILAPT